MIVTGLRYVVENQGNLDQWAQNLMVESITVHGRLLEDFFNSDKSKPDAAVVQDYLSADREAQKRWRKMRRRLGWSPLPRERINREIVHLSYLRIYGNAPEKGWVPGPFVEWVGKMFLALFLVVDANRFPASLVERYRNLFTSVGVSHNPAVDPNNDPPEVAVAAENYSVFDSIDHH